MRDVLFSTAVLDRRASKWQVLSFSFRLVPKLLESFGYVPWHGQVHLALDVVPIEGDADVTSAAPVGGDLVVLF